MINKRTFSGAMETEEEDSSQTSKKQEFGEEDQMIKVIETKGNKK